MVRQNAGMDVTNEMSYPGSSVDAVVAMLFDPDFRTAVCKATMAISSEVDIQSKPDGGAVVTVSRTMPAEGPDFVRRFVGETIQLSQSETWAPDDGSGVRRADFTLSVVGQPATMTGTIVVAETADGARELVRGSLKVSVPFFGGRIEAEVAKALAAAARVEQRTGREWLAR
jgi:uncharacterized protein DUF2505